MLTRLKVSGFKNLDDVDVRFGPFTCVAGANGVGKSNLFDAIAFLSALADKPLMEAALAVRGGDAGRGDVHTLFRRTGARTSDEMRFVAELLIPETGEDALGQPAHASMTYLRYELGLRYRADAAVRSMGTLEVTFEEMTHISRTDAKKSLGFPHEKAWRDSVVKGERRSKYISTDHEQGAAIVSLHADSGGAKGGGRPRRVPAATLPRTMLSTVNNAAEHRTLVLARQEMMSWTQLQLEPSALRAHDRFTSPRSIGPNGSHLAATMYTLAQRAESVRAGGAEDVYAGIANRLSELVENIRRVSVDVDEKRQLLTVVLTDRHHTEHTASALSDGTLRFLALTVMETDPSSRGLLCLEEPENGMHPSRIPAVIELLEDLAVDVGLPVGEDNPLRQVIINTHSPTVAGCVADNALLIAQLVASARDGAVEARLDIRHLPKTWRDADGGHVVTRGELRLYLDPLAAAKQPEEPPRLERRVMERSDLLQPMLPFMVAEPRR